MYSNFLEVLFVVVGTALFFVFVFHSQKQNNRNMQAINDHHMKNEIKVLECERDEAEEEIKQLKKKVKVMEEELNDPFRKLIRNATESKSEEA